MAGRGSPKGVRKGGRATGTPNKCTQNAREAIAAFVNGNAPRLSLWLDEIYETDGPKVAFDCVRDLLEYHVPKLARTELTGGGGKELIPATIIIQGVKSL